MKVATILADASTIEDPSEDRRSSPYLLLALYKYDNGGHKYRTNRPEYIRREPWSVHWADDHLGLTITNLGEVASDLVQVEYQFRLCVNPLHRLDEGFVHPHAGEIENNTIENGKFLDFVPAMGKNRPGTIVLPIVLPDLPTNIANLYFRAKVFTLWSKPTLPATWNFATDITVVEATKRFVP